MVCRRVGSVAVLLVCGCNFQIPSPTYLNETKLIATAAEVTAIGPLNPARVGVPFDTAIAEAMPGDQLTLSVTVVNPDGEVLGPDEVETIWLQCGVLDCGTVGTPLEMPEFDVPCDELDPHTLDSFCRLGEGDVNFEFEVPALAEGIVEERVEAYYGVVAWNGRSAQDCWASRRARDGVLDNCGFTQHQVKIGPSWWLLVYADSIGLSSSIPVWQIPAAVYGQPANRTPNPIIHVTVDGELLGSYPDVTSFSARLGDPIHIDVEYDPIEQLTQIYFYALFDDESQSYWFSPGQEVVTDIVYTTKSIHAVGDDMFKLRRDFVVDEYADPGSAQMFVVFSDDRFGVGVARLDFEVTN